MNTLTKITLGLVTVISGGAYVPIIPTDLEAGLAEVPAMRGYQYIAGSDRTDWRLINGEMVNMGMLPDADFVDEDNNGVISVGTFTDRKGQNVYAKIPDTQYAQMGEKNGSMYNPTKTELIPLFDTFIAPIAVDAAIAVDATSEGYANSTSVTIAHTVTGTDTAIVVSLWTFPNGDVATGITYNAEALSKRGTIATDATGYQNIWGASGADTGTHNIVVLASPSSQLFVTAASYTGVDQTTPFPTTAVTGSSAGTSFTASITTTVDQSWLALGGRSPSRNPTAGANTIVRKLNGTSGDAGWLLDSDGARSTGSNSLAWSYSPSATSYWVLIDIAPTSAVPETPQTPVMYMKNGVKVQGNVILSN